jgi:hypothetical protein
VIAVSKQGQTVKAGIFDGIKKDLEVKNLEYPCCLYGSYSLDGFEMLGLEKVEPA